jgi:hypothetical protein
MLKLTRENYHSLEANQQYMSNSQYKSFLDCEAMAVAKVRGEWVPEKSDALLAGSYLHAWSEGTLEEFKAITPELFTKKGELYAQYKYIDRMIDCLRQDEFCMFVLQGQKEVIMTAEFGGVMWKIMMDIYSPDRERFVDIKSTRSISELVWSPEDSQKVSFIEMYSYPRQFAVYAEIERLVTGRSGWLEPLVVAVSKEDPPDKAIISMVDPVRTEYELTQIKLNLPHILAVKSGQEQPTRCETCDYCRATKKISRIIHFTELMSA